MKRVSSPGAEESGETAAESNAAREYDVESGEINNPI
jgi:hypothetical protein